MKLLITGICGFVGSETALGLREACPESDLQIYGLDNLSRNGSWRNRDRLAACGIRVCHGDIRSPDDVTAIGPVDWVLDAAANPSVLAGLGGGSGSRQLVGNNLFGTVNLLEHCRRYNAGFVLLSTSRVYSIPPLSALPLAVADSAFYPAAEASLPPGITAAGISEIFSTAAPVSLYGATKLASEQLALEYGHTFGFPVRINRCGVMAGAGQFGRADQGIFAFWLHSWKERRPLKYIGFDGHGRQVRDCLHPRDLVPLLMRQFGSDQDQRPPIVNVSGGAASARSLAQLSEWCTARWGPRDVGSDTSPRPFDLPWVVLDAQAAEHAWNWRPETTTDQILNQIADFADRQTDWIEFSR